MGSPSDNLADASQSAPCAETSGIPVVEVEVEEEDSKSENGETIPTMRKYGRGDRRGGGNSSHMIGAGVSLWEVPAYSLPFA